MFNNANNSIPLVQSGEFGLSDGNTLLPSKLNNSLFEIPLHDSSMRSLMSSEAEQSSISENSNFTSDNTGVFKVSGSGTVSFDYLVDGGGFQGELAIFSLNGMEESTPGSTAFIREAALRALSNSEFGHVVINDAQEGARFDGSPGEPNSNTGEYLGVKAFSMNAGDEFGIMLVPNGTVRQVLSNPSTSGNQRPLFSLPTANPGEQVQFAQIIDAEADGNSFAFEDLPLNSSDRDYNDIIFQIQGATGHTPLLNDLINPSLDWRNSDLGREVEVYAANNKNGPLSKVGFDLATAFVEYEAYLRNGGNPSAFEPSNFLLQTQDSEIVIEAIASSDPNTLLADLTELGLQDGKVFESVVSGLLPIQAINKVSTLTSLAFAKPAYAPETNVGQVDDQGDQALNANAARTNFAVNGAGVTVGVISNSFNNPDPKLPPLPTNATADVTSNDLPGAGNTNGFTTPVNVLAERQDKKRNTDEGRAMLQLIHDVAPGANLAFRTGSRSMTDFATGIVDLADAGANVIVDDLLYYDEPMFQDGIVAQAVDRVVDRGVSYFSSATNFGRSSYESAFRPSGQRIDGAIAHNFDSGSGVATLQPISIRNRNPAVTNDPDRELVISLQWDSPFRSATPASGGATNDLDIYLLDATGKKILARSTNRNIGADAVELLTFKNTNTVDPANPGATQFTQFNLAITSASGTFPAQLKYLAKLRNGSTTGSNPDLTINQFETNSPTVYGHAAAVGAMAVGATDYRTTPAFDGNPATLEAFSSIGPTTILFDRFGTRLATPDSRQKPEIVAPDGANTTFFGRDIFEDADGDGVDDDTFPNFFGTSAAAPHAAAVAALMLQAFPGSLPKQIYQALRDSALDMDNPYTGVFDVGVDDATGSGLIEADAAIRALQRIQNPRPEINLQLPNISVTPSLTRGDNEFDGNGPRIRIQTQVSAQGTKLRLDGTDQFVETTPDFTTFSSSFLREIDIPAIYRNQGFIIDSILSDNSDALGTVDVDLHDTQTIAQDRDDLVASYEIEGDSNGDDEPFVTVSFNPVKVRLRNPTSGATVEDEFLLPDITQFTPNLVRGDREFDGHGPRIVVQTEVRANGSILTPRLNATFEEYENGQPRRDFTTFAGNINGSSVDVSQRYPGFVVDSILSKTSDALETTDVDIHDIQTISEDSKDLVAKYELQGDSQGRDKPFANISFNPVRVRLRPA